MQDQRSHQIEHVEHNFISNILHTCCIVDYYRKEDVILQLNYIDEKTAREDRQNQSIGLWKSKTTDK